MPLKGSCEDCGGRSSKEKFHISDIKQDKVETKILNNASPTPLQPALPLCVEDKCSLPNLLPGSSQLPICGGGHSCRGCRFWWRAEIFQQKGVEGSHEKDVAGFLWEELFQKWTSSAVCERGGWKNPRTCSKKRKERGKQWESEKRGKVDQRSQVCLVI